MDSFINTFPNPWEFSNTDKSMLSPSGRYCIEYGDLMEIGMGAPLRGPLYIKNLKTGKRSKVFESAGGPPIWDTKADIVAVPVWWRHFLLGTYQKLLLINIKTTEVILYKQRFGVLDLRGFSDGIVYGYDSPTHKPKTLSFNINQNKIMFKKAINPL